MKRPSEEKQKDLKAMKPITREEACGIFEMYIGKIGKQYDLEITDAWAPRWPAYPAKQLNDCWYLTFRVISDGRPVGPSGLAAMCKASGKILYSSKMDEHEA